MKTRKTILLAAIAALSVVCVLQAILGHRDPVKLVELAEADTPDSITIARGDGSTVALAKQGDLWVVGEKKYPADMNRVSAMLSSIRKIKLLGTVSGSNDYDRYGLAEGACVTVTASKAGKVLRTIAAGKNASASGQSYGIVDGGPGVSLVSGSLKDAFDLDAESLRDLTVWEVAAAGITRIAAEAKGKDAGFVLAKAGDPAVWQIASPESAKSFAVDGAKADAWAKNFASMRAASFAADDARLPETTVARFTIQSAGKETVFTIGEKKEGAKPEDAAYLCSSSASPYAFYLKAAEAEKLLAPYTTLGK